ncbi:hypothetical protein EC957_012249 [Mortierella hygrophila]|uniref:alpha-galactosidase n=1 Tax=Mortierella hygrophila TaxID=979708 RepID=A0A9P6K3D5_9FUNG|nr:hypothetical protein EC957_012249 [Mortierella hygrophila]
MTEHLHLPAGPWTSEEIFRAISTHPLEIKTAYSVLVAPPAPITPMQSPPSSSSSPTSSASNRSLSSAATPPPGPPRRRQVQQRVTLRENETKTLYLTQDFSQHFTDVESAYNAALLNAQQYQQRQLRSLSSRQRSKSGSGPDLTLLPVAPPPASLVTLQVSSSTTRLSERSAVRTIELSITPSPDAADTHISDVITLKSLTARHIRLPLEGKSALANGYQSWSTSYLGADETTVFENPNWLYHELTKLALGSDRHIFEYPAAKGMLHSNVVTTLRDKCLDPNRTPPPSPAVVNAAAASALRAAIDPLSVKSPATPASTPLASRNSTLNGKAAVTNNGGTGGSTGPPTSGNSTKAHDSKKDEVEEKREFEPRPEELVLLGSLSEDKAYSYFLMDTNRDSLTILQDCKGKKLKANGERWVMKTFITWDTKDTAVWDAYAATWTSHLGDRRAIRNSLTHQLSGWTSWYLHYENINEQVIHQNLEHYASTSSHHEHHARLDHVHGGKREWPGKVFQIDDGYTTVGDWLDYDRIKFPGGMEAIARAIREKGLTPGIWLAPFLVSKKSKIARDKPHWLAQQPWPPTSSRRDGTSNDGDDSDDDLSGLGCCGGGINTGRPGSTRPVHAHPAFSVGAYLLDLENPEVREYLANVFRVVVQEWGFKMLKLDFLFGAALLARNGKTRGQLMYEAMQMVRDWAGPDTILLGCGVPLGASFNLVDYCRIGSDVGPEWDTMQRHFHDREYISCKNSLTSTLSRWALSGRFFGNDPDVYFIRDWKIGLNITERRTLILLNHLLGHLVFTSDYMDPTKLNDAQKRVLDSFFPWPSTPGSIDHPSTHSIHPLDPPKIIRVLQPNPTVKDLYLIQVSHNSKTYIIATNLSSKRQTVHLSALDQIIIRESPPPPLHLLPTPPQTSARTGGASKHSLFGNSTASLLSSSSTFLLFTPSTTSTYFQTETGQFGSAAAAYALNPHESCVFLRVLDNYNQLCTSATTSTIPILPRENLSVIEVLDIQDPLPSHAHNNTSHTHTTSTASTTTITTTTTEQEEHHHKHILQKAGSLYTSNKHLFPAHPQVHILATSGGHILPTSEIEALSFVNPQNPDIHELSIKWRGNFFPRRVTLWLAWKVNHDHPNKYHKRPWVVNGVEAPTTKILQGTGLQVAIVTLNV